MFVDQHTNGPLAKQHRQVGRAIARHQDAETRKEAARDKRARKAEKRANDARSAEIGRMKSREALEMGLPRGMWHAGVYAAIEGPFA
jgi:hypothetical protein